MFTEAFPCRRKPCSFTELLEINVPQNAKNCYYLLLGSFWGLLLPLTSIFWQGFVLASVTFL